MTWQILILTSVFLYSVVILLQRVLLKDNKSDPKAYSIFFQLLTGLFIGVFGLSFTNMSFPNIRPLIFNLILMTLFYGFGNIFIFQALKSIEASRFTIIFASRALFTILASFLFLQEQLSFRQMWGAFFILLGIVLVNIKSAKLQFSKKELIAVLAAAAFGFANTNDRFLLKSFAVYPYVFLAFIVPAFLVMFLYPYTIKKMQVFLEEKLLLKMLLLCVISAVSSITFFLAFQKADNASQVVSANLTSVIITVLLAAIFLKERDYLPQKLIGAVVSFIGLLLVS